MPGNGSPIPTRAHRVLLVDEDGAMRRLLRHALTQFGCDAYEARDAPEMRGMLQRHTICAVVLDVPGPAATHLAALADLDTLPTKRRSATIAISSDPTALTCAASLGVPSTLLKPFSLHLLQDAIEHVVAHETSCHSSMTPLPRAVAAISARYAGPMVAEQSFHHQVRWATHG